MAKKYLIPHRREPNKKEKYAKLKESFIHHSIEYVEENKNSKSLYFKAFCGIGLWQGIKRCVEFNETPYLLCKKCRKSEKTT